MTTTPLNNFDQSEDTITSANNKILNPQFSDLKKPETFINEIEKLSSHGVITGEQLLNDPVEQMDWLIENLIPRIGVGALAGQSDTGKSCVLRQSGINICAGEDHFLGFPLHQKHHSAIIVSTEDDSTAMKYLLSKQAGSRKPSDLKKLRFIFEYDNLIPSIEFELQKQPTDIIIVDCFSDAYSGDLKDTSKIRAYLSEWQKIAVKYECFIMFLHHTGKRTEDKEPSKNNLLSGQGFEAKMRLVIELRADPMNPNYRHFCIVKGNYLPADMKRESYVLEFNEDTFSFANTGERTPFELLIKNYDDPGKAKFEQVRELKGKGYTLEKIATKMGYKNKSSVSRLLEKGEKNEW